MKPPNAMLAKARMAQWQHYYAGEIPGGLDHEELVVIRGERSGATMMIAVHSTVLGPSLGGLRMWHYDAEDDALADVLRLSAAMTRKAAVAGLDLGGGKGVIALPSGEPPSDDSRRAMLLDFGDLVASLEGRYVTAEDVGTTPGDMRTVAERTGHVTGLDDGRCGDPSPFTAIGVEAAMRAATRRRLGHGDPARLRVAIVGTGHVGELLARSLARQGTELLLCDLDPARRSLAEELEASWLDPADAMTAECDVLAPCAVGGALNEANVDLLRCRIVCGAANNQLATPEIGDRLDARGILYAPDYVANAGGIIGIRAEMLGDDAEHATEHALAIEETMDSVFELAEHARSTPARAAEALAARRLAAA